MGFSGVRILVSLVGTISPLKIVLSPVNMTPGTLGTGFGRDWSLTKNKQKLKFILLNKTSYQITTLSQEMYKRKPELITNPGPSTICWLSSCLLLYVFLFPALICLVLARISVS